MHTQTYNIYCDESCHLENDGHRLMALGAIWAPESMVAELGRSSKELKQAFGLSREFELKWGKVSGGKLDYYTAVLDWFWSTPELHFRGLVVPDKTKLDHAGHNQTHDDWYYKMYFDLLKVIIDPHQKYNIYLDIKDTRGGKKVAELHEVLSNKQYDFKRSIIDQIQLVRSHEIQLLQLTDFVIGLIAYANRGLTENSAKLSLVQRLRAHSKYSLTHSTLLRESKLNLFLWHTQEKV
jgi:hypothetical protein